MKRKELIRSFHEDESGQDLVEYGLVLATVLAAIVTGSDAIAAQIAAALATLSTRIQSAVAAGLMATAIVGSALNGDGDGGFS